ncbi:MAG: HAMP domain-containing protein, partial [Deltaproteobacteria bacterium]|nr:HAMP domain-containing protein [Deltaproteobacteria bacterium]
MKIEKRLSIMLAVSLVILIAFGASLIYSYHQERISFVEHDMAEEIYQKTFKLNALAYDYLMNPTERALEQWRQLSDDLANLSSTTVYVKEEQKAILHEINSRHKAIDDSFRSLVRIHSDHDTMETKRHELYRDLETRVSSHLLLEMQTIIELSIRMGRIGDDQLGRIRNITSIVRVGFFVILFFMLMLNAYWQRKGIILPVKQLMKGVEIIGAGDLDYKTGIATNDEIGELSAAFDRMTDNLKHSTE